MLYEFSQAKSPENDTLERNGCQQGEAKRKGREDLLYLILRHFGQILFHLHHKRILRKASAHRLKVSRLPTGVSVRAVTGPRRLVELDVRIRQDLFDIRCARLPVRWAGAALRRSGTPRSVARRAASDANRREEDV